jgi:hypothetical protein
MSLETNKVAVGFVVSTYPVGLGRAVFNQITSYMCVCVLYSDVILGRC